MESPSTEIGGDWLWWNTVTLGSPDGSAAANDDGGQLWARVPLESKAMRKVNANQVLIFVMHNVVSASTLSISVAGIVRVLMKT